MKFKSSYENTHTDRIAVAVHKHRLQKDKPDPFGPPLASAHYEYDNMGRRTSMTREGDQIDRYHYDATSQLTGVDYGHVGAPQAALGSGGMGDPPMGSSSMGFQPMSSEYFTYDPLGNRITHTATTPSGVPEITQYQPNNLNQYTRVDDTVFSYDPNGSLLNDGAQRYGYDAQSRLIAVETESARAEFAYDARNRCILRKYFVRSDDGEWMPNEKDSVVLTYDTAWNLLVDRDLAGRQTAKYVHGNRVDEILVNIQAAGAYYPHGDALGSVIALSDDNGQKEAVVKYTAYGLPVHAPERHRLLHTGREWLAPVQLNDHRNRYYSPTSGRWLTTDPIRFAAGDVNVYRYIFNSISNYTDNSGLIISIIGNTAAFNEAKMANLADSVFFGDAYGHLQDSPDTYTIIVGAGGDNIFHYPTKTISWDPNKMWVPDNNSVGISAATILGHEMQHAAEFQKNPEGYKQQTSAEREAAVMGAGSVEKQLATKRKEAIRTSHSGGKYKNANGILDNNSNPCP